MVLAVSRDRALSLAEFLALPETQPASEYINGQVHQKPMPQGQHSYLQSELTAVLNSVLRKARIARAGAELRCTFGGRVLVPDIVVVKWDRIPRQSDGRVANSFDFAPDWIVEIASPQQPLIRLIEKMQFCLDQGTEMAWLIDPEDLSVLVYQAGRSPRAFVDLGDRLPVPDFAQGVALMIEDLQSFLLN
jgi:Uma2 family endonuclease